MPGLFDLTGHVSLITGAASGLGLAYAEVLAEYGAHVVMTDIDTANLQSHAARIGAEAIVLDAGDAEALHRTIDSTVASHGRLDSLFANVGVSAGSGFALSDGGTLENMDLDGWERVLRVNLSSSLLAMRYAIPHMKRQGGGRIIVTSSIGGMRAEPLVGYAYAATKAGLNNLVRQAAVELAPHNILVNAIAPGPFMTNIGGGRLHTRPDIVAKFAAMVPLARLGRAEEIKGLALLLASPAGSYMTGSVIPIDGGATAL